MIQIEILFDTEQILFFFLAHNTSYKLRERRREREKLMNKIKSKNNNKPTVTIQWIREEDLVMWEVRNYWST